MVLAPAVASVWWYAIFVLALVALVLDGVDGWASRRTGLVSPFGARFDMEVDALLVLILSASACLHGKAGGWVLLIGAMRYLFVAAGLAKPALRRPLPPSLRRQAVCVLQVATLAILLLPEVVSPVSTALAAAALVALTWSFAIDVHWLLRTGRTA
jgi:phosphatidylglycerophosphate synthase